ncbi:MAG: hypothetical protein WB773_05320 [Isosphaeraceae bacterium]
MILAASLFLLLLALKTSLPALTTEREWEKCGLAVEVVKIR